MYEYSGGIAIDVCHAYIHQVSSPASKICRHCSHYLARIRQTTRQRRYSSPNHSSLAVRLDGTECPTPVA